MARNLQPYHKDQCGKPLRSCQAQYDAAERLARHILGRFWQHIGQPPPGVPLCHRNRRLQGQRSSCSCRGYSRWRTGRTTAGLPSRCCRYRRYGTMPQWKQQRFDAMTLGRGRELHQHRLGAKRSARQMMGNARTTEAARRQVGAGEIRTAQRRSVGHPAAAAPAPSARRIPASAARSSGPEVSLPHRPGADANAPRYTRTNSTGPFRARDASSFARSRSRPIEPPQNPPSGSF
jgi:hypothetical protein